MGTKATWAMVGAGISTATVAILSWLGLRWANTRLERNRVVVSETLPVHSQWWRDHAKREGELLYVALGDSAAQGIGASVPHNSYVGLIANHVREVTGRSVRVVNLSVSGATVATAAAEQLPRFRTFTPDLVTVAIGANNISAFDPTAFEEGIRAVFDALPPDAIVADVPCFYLPHNERKVAVANRILREAAAERDLTVAPLHETMKRQGVKGMLTQFANDMFHPNDHGYRVWASAFLPTVTARMLEKYPDAADDPVDAATP
ncbi:SGNH/GDSL hydrolase family protein [Diaminobutyricibacter sp. McL0618]|uniref:SGNH/GDSL hydrolase family protein n=1 Tax=Leifsonia sp. McL0618 TaxID=3415677 RepID=UPI003CF6FC11